MKPIRWQLVICHQAFPPYPLFRTFKHGIVWQPKETQVKYQTRHQKLLIIEEVNMQRSLQFWTFLFWPNSAFSSLNASVLTLDLAIIYSWNLAQVAVAVSVVGSVSLKAENSSSCSVKWYCHSNTVQRAKKSVKQLFEKTLFWLLTF